MPPGEPWRLRSTTGPEESIHRSHPPVSQFMNDLSAHRTSHQGWAIDVLQNWTLLPAPCGGRLPSDWAGSDPEHASTQPDSESALAMFPAYPVLASATQFPLPTECASFVHAMSALFHLSLVTPHTYNLSGFCFRGVGHASGPEALVAGIKDGLK